MPRLIDDIRAAGRMEKPWFVREDKVHEWGAHTEFIWAQLQRRDMPVLLIDNVSEYMYSGTDQEYWDLGKDFPNVAPPYPQFWAEHRTPRVIHSKEKGDTDIAALVPNGRVGVLVTAYDVGSVALETEIPQGARWVLLCELLMDWGGACGKRYVDGTIGTICIIVDAEGRVMERPFMRSYCAPEHNDLMCHYMTWLHPTLLAVSFLHCKNVRVDEHTVDKPLAKKFRARHGVEPTGWKTLVIEPLKAVLRHEGKADAQGLAKALHICRGHFRDYREGRGLFGKYHVLAWTPMTVRGTKGKQAPPREVEIRV